MFDLVKLFRLVVTVIHCNLQVFERFLLVILRRVDFADQKLDNIGGAPAFNPLCAMARA